MSGFGASWAVLAAVLWANAAEAVVNRSPDRILIYYANETTERVFQSETYAVLLAALARSGAPAAAQLSEHLRADARLFPDAVRRDVADLSEAAKRLNFDLAVFTNALAHDGRYLFLRGGVGEAEPMRIPELPAAANPILAASPLARADFLRAALATVAAAYPGGSLDAVLITNSHGGGDLAIAPRVFADLSRADPADVLAEFEGAPRPASARAGMGAAQGVAKQEYWRLLDKHYAAGGMRFALVFRQACESGVSSWSELAALPESIGAVAHTATGRIGYRDVDYASVFAVGELTGLLSDHVALRLERSGIQVDRPGRMWTWLVRDAAAAAWPYLLFLPLATWLGWYVRFSPPASSRRRLKGRSLNR